MRAFIKKWVLLSIMLLTACADPQVILKPQQVDVAVPIINTAQCPRRPALPTAQLTANATMTNQVRALLQDRAVLNGYAAQLAALCGHGN